MTIKDFAAEKGISTQAVYKRLTKQGISINQITDLSTKAVTAEGLTVLYQLFQQKQPTNHAKGSQVAKGETVDNTQDERLTAARQRVEELTAELKAAQREIEYLKRENALLSDTLNAERAIFIAKLPAPAADKPSLPDRLRAWWKGGKHD